MYPRTEYEMTEAQERALLEASRPTRVMMIGGYSSPGPQENANAAWAMLGREMGFDSMSVRPVAGKNQRHFSAVPSETPEQRDARMVRAAEDRRVAEIARLSAEIEEREQQLLTLRESA